MLPVGPPGYGESPYSAQCSFAGDPMLVSPEALVEARWLDDSALAEAGRLPGGRVDVARTHAHRTTLLRLAFEGFERTRSDELPFDEFCHASRSWLDDFALFRALKRENGGAEWTRWPSGERERDPRALDAARSRLAGEVAFERFVQYAFDRQWQALRARASDAGIDLMGDLPIFVAHDSVDVWRNPDDFFLDEHGRPTVVAGVPPDYFSATGQRWGNPLYRWRRMRAGGYAWWIDRLRTALRRFDALRLDHFIGFRRYWRIAADEPTATRGRWMRGPGEHFFDSLRSALGELPFVAEDLGEVTPAVYALRDRYRFPGIKILQFAFGDDPAADSFLPHNYPRRAVVYTGTHDNDTTVGWFCDPGGEGSARTPSQTAAERRAALRYLGTHGDEIHWEMIRLALSSVASLAMFPLQDVLGLGSEARMNLPGTATGNWTWRFEGGALTAELARRLGDMTHVYGRAR